MCHLMCRVEVRSFQRWLRRQGLSLFTEARWHRLVPAVPHASLFASWPPSEPWWNPRWVTPIPRAVARMVGYG